VAAALISNGFSVILVLILLNDLEIYCRVWVGKKQCGLACPGGKPKLRVSESSFADGKAVSRSLSLRPPIGHRSMLMFSV